MSIEELRGISTIFCLIAFIGVLYWAYGPSRKEYFSNASRLPFEDENENKNVKGS